MMRDFWIDTDTASDDAVALIMALWHKGVSVRGISTVAGNVAIEKGTRNALYVAELCGADVPVFVGAGRPLKRAPAHAEWFHGKDGLGDQNYPPAKRKAERGHAVDAMIAAAKRWPGLTLVTLGPLTNVALAMKKSPGFVKNVGRLVIMGGAACTEGNVTPAAEYNVWCDPEAADIVFRARWSVPAEMVGWELCRFDAAFGEVDMKKLLALNTTLGTFAVDCNRVAIEAYRVQTGERAMSLPDPVAMAIALEPKVCVNTSLHKTMVETQSELTSGMTVVDRLNVAGDGRNKQIWRRAGTVHICWKIDVPRFKRMVIDACR